MRNYNLKFTKITKVKSPERGTPGSAGIDFFIPENINCIKNANDYKFTEHTNENNFEIIIKPGQSILIGSGIKVKVPGGFALIAFNKSGIAIKKSLLAGACVIDSDYEGEIHFDLKNVSNKEVKLSSNDKILQFLLMPVNHQSPIEISTPEELFKDSQSERGEGRFGSTNI